MELLSTLKLAKLIMGRNLLKAAGVWVSTRGRHRMCLTPDTQL